MIRNEFKEERKLEKLGRLFQKSLKSLLKEDLNNETLKEIIEIIAPIEIFDSLVVDFGRKILDQNPNYKDLLFVFLNIEELRSEVLKMLLDIDEKDLDCFFKEMKMTSVNLENEFKGTSKIFLV